MQLVVLGTGMFRGVSSKRASVTVSPPSFNIYSTSASIFGFECHWSATYLRVRDNVCWLCHRGDIEAHQRRERSTR